MEQNKSVPTGLEPITRSLLRMVLWFKPMYQQWGVDSHQLALMLHYKLLMDQRRPTGFQQMSRNKASKPTNFGYAWLLIGLVTGVMLIFALMVGADPVTRISFFFSGLVFLLSAMLISDFTSVLIDVRDNSILLPRPVNDRTLLLAKLLHILVHISKLLLPMLIAPLIYIGSEWGWRAVFALLPVVPIAICFSILLVNSVYLLVLRVTSAEKFKNFIAWFQIIFAVAVYGAYQFLPRFTDEEEMKSFVIGNRGYAPYLPPYWFARSWDFFRGENWLSNAPWLFLSLVSCALSLFIVIRFLAPAFARKIAGLSGSSAAAGIAASHPLTARNNRPRTKFSPAIWISKWVCRNPIEQHSFLFTWRFTGRSREFKMKVYPGFGYMLVIFFMQFYRNFKQLSTDGPGFILYGSIYLSGFILISAIEQVGHSEQYKAAWIFWRAPLAKPGDILIGSTKAVLIKFSLLLALLLLMVSTWLLGPAALPNALLAIGNQWLVTLLLQRRAQQQLPASLPPISEGKGSAMLKTFFVMMLLGVFVVIHYLLYNIPWAIGLLTLLVWIAVWLLLSSIRNTPWREVDG